MVSSNHDPQEEGGGHNEGGRHFLKRNTWKKVFKKCPLKNVHRKAVTLVNVTSDNVHVDVGSLKSKA